MNLYELADKVEFDEMPASETARNIRQEAMKQPDKCPHQEDDGSCSIICVCDKQHPYGGEEPL